MEDETEATMDLYDDPRANDGGMDAVSPHFDERLAHYAAPRGVHNRNILGALVEDERCDICNPSITGNEGGFEG